MHNYEIVEKLMPYCAVRGREEPYLEAVAKELSKYSEVTTNHLYTLCNFKKKQSTGKKILLLAHCSTPGYLVSKIDKSGMLKMVPIDAIGNLNPITTWSLPYKPIEAETVGKSVMVYGKKAFEGVVPAPPVHYQGSVGTLAKADGLYAVTGYNEEQVKQLVSPGDAITYSPYLKRTMNDNFFGPFLEYRIPSALLLRIAELISKEELKCDVTLAIVGGSNFAGAVKAVKEVKPDELIIISTTEAESYKGKGVVDDGSVVQFFGSAIHYSFSEQLEASLHKNGAKHQRIASVFTTDTPADECGYVDEGYPTAMFAIPVQYSRSGISQVNENSVEYLAQQLSAYLATGKE